MPMPCLPQNDPDPDARIQGIEAQRAHFPWDHSYVAPIGMLHLDSINRLRPSPVFYQFLLPGMDPALAPPPGYIRGRLASLTTLWANDLAILPRTAPYLFTPTPEWALAHFPFSLADHERLFVKLPKPAAVRLWQDPDFFTYQRLGGANPFSLRRVAHDKDYREVLPNLYLEDNQGNVLPRVAEVLGPGLTPRQLARDKRLFICDYSMLAYLPIARDGQGQRHTAPCIGVFYTDEHKRLRPLAIQLGLHGAPDRVVTPLDGPRWKLGMLVLQSADANYHEVAQHLLRCHLLLESIFVAAQRCLSQEHPLLILLKPHFAGHLWNNFQGRELLIQPGGRVAQLMGGGSYAAAEIIKNELVGAQRYPGSPPPFSFREYHFECDIEDRGVEDIADYPYREDGRRVWRALFTFVNHYLRLYYGGDTDVANDRELAAWLNELSSDDGARIRGASGLDRGLLRVQHSRHLLSAQRDLGLDELANIMTSILFTCGPRHSLLNFGQYPYMSFVPNMPLALYASVPLEVMQLDDEVATARLLRMLPPPAKVVAQFDTIVELTSYHHDRLGQYPASAFSDPAVTPLIKALQRDLAQVEAEIDADNQRRAHPYELLRPSQILNATNI